MLNTHRAPGMPVGADVKLVSPHREQKGTVDRTPIEALHDTAELGLDGVLFRTLYEMSPALDGGLLAEIAAEAAHLGLYLEVGIGKVNPYMTAEFPEIRRLGAGSYLGGMQRLIAAAAAIGCHELWSAGATYKAGLPGLFRNDRYRTDVDWPDQLAAIAGFLTLLAPTLRRHGSRINLETHEEITSAELVDLTERVGPDVVGIVFDCANVTVHGEYPQDAARRVAPYTRMTHLRDVVMVPDGTGGLDRYLAPCGDGIIDWTGMLDILRAGNPSLHLTIEPAGPRQPAMPVPLQDPRWAAAHPDTDPAEIAALHRSVDVYREKAGAHGLPDHDALAAGGIHDRAGFLTRSAGELRRALARPDQPAGPSPATA